MDVMGVQLVAHRRWWHCEIVIPTFSSGSVSDIETKGVQTAPYADNPPLVGIDAPWTNSAPGETVHKTGVERASGRSNRFCGVWSIIVRPRSV